MSSQTTHCDLEMTDIKARTKQKHPFDFKHYSRKILDSMVAIHLISDGEFLVVSTIV